MSPLHLAWLTPPTTATEDLVFSAVVQILDAGDAINTAFAGTVTGYRGVGHRDLKWHAHLYAGQWGVYV